MARTIGGIVAGIVAAFATIWCIEMVGHMVYPIPAEIDPTDLEAVGELIGSLPVGALMFVVAAWFGGALSGGAVAALITGLRWSAWLVAGLVAVAALLNILMIPHPEWMQVSALIAPALGGIVAGHFARRREVAVEGPADAAL